MTLPLTVKVGWSDEEWDAALREKREATFFHTRRWAGVAKQAFPGLVDRSVWWAGPAGDVHLPVFLWQRARGLVSTAQSSFPFLYGGPVPLQLPDDVDPLHVSIEHMRRLRASIRITGNPFAVSPTLDSSTPPVTTLPGASVKRGLLPGNIVETSDHTHVLDLPETEDQYWESLSTGKRNDFRRLLKKGLEIEESARREDVDSAYALYRASFARWGGAPSFVHPPELYHALVALGPPFVRFTVARFEGRVVGAAFVLRWNERAHYFAGYFDHEARQLRPNVLIQIDSIRAAIRSGIRQYDFLPSGGHAAVEEFKAGLGGQPVTFSILEERRYLHRALDYWRQLRRTEKP